MFVRTQVKAELRRRVTARVPLTQNVAWLRSTGAGVGDALELLQGIGLNRKEAEYVLRAHPAWRDALDTGHSPPRAGPD
jgi:uncharacterized protein YjiS (DUF1127 family)